MSPEIPRWIWQHPDWPRFHWRDAEVQPCLRRARLCLGILLGKAGGLPETAGPSAALDTLLQNILSSSAIEGERLNAHSVRSSLANRLGVCEEAPYPVSDRSEGVAQLMLDAIGQADAPLTLERLFQWHCWLFPVFDPVWQRVLPGCLRGEEPMQVVSGRLDRPTVHFEAPPRARLEAELADFLAWFRASGEDAALDPLLRAGLCHFYFVTLHPFDDGNGRITRALTDMALVQADRQAIRLYSVSAAILARRRDYYRVLEQCQRAGLDITDWLVWFLETVMQAVQTAEAALERTLARTRFWRRHQGEGLSAAQVKVLNRLLDGGEDGFPLGISAAQYAAVAKVSKATATRHLAELVEKGCLERLPGGGRSTRYGVVV